MYQPAAFREDSPAAHFDLIRGQPLGMLITAGPAGLLANAIPFVGYPDEGGKGVLRTHVARANPQWRELAGLAECLVIFQGPQAYVSPTWSVTKEETHRIVPTWNYAVVQMRGRPKAIEDVRWLRRQIDDLTLLREGGRPNPWSVSEAPEDYVSAQLRAIVGIEIEITAAEGKWKMSQNRSEADRHRVIEGLAGEGGEGKAVAGLVAKALSKPEAR